MTSVSSFFLPKHDYIIKLNIVKRLQHRKPKLVGSSSVSGVLREMPTTTLTTVSMIRPQHLNTDQTLVVYVF